MSESFAPVPSDSDLMQYRRLDELIDDYLPGNYTPTQSQAQELIREGMKAAVRWESLRASFPEHFAPPYTVE
jgi:hypothetical protein